MVLKDFKAATFQNVALLLSSYSYLHLQNIFPTFSFPAFKSVQTKITSSKIMFAVLLLTIFNFRNILGAIIGAFSEAF